MNNILLTICARGGSKGIPGKNIKLLDGIPLIAHSIKVGQEFAKRHHADFALSTDSPAIKVVAEEFGLITEYERPAEMATDKAGKIGAIEHIWKFQEDLKGKRYDYVIDMDVTSPLRTVEDMETAFRQLQKVPEALNIFSVNVANRNPYFNMVEKHPDSDYVSLVKSNGLFKSRQQAPLVYDMNASFYIFRRKFFEEGHEISITDRSLAYVMPHICFDLDEPHDFTVMEIMIREKLLDFEF